MSEITEHLVSQLIKAQFPHWSDLPIKPVAVSGNDNRTFHLGDEMSVRLPSKDCYVPQVEKELFWLPKLQPHLTLPISAPIAKGEPAEGYPWPWSINKWIEGETVRYENVQSINQLAIDLAHFLKELQSIDCTGGPIAGLHNFYRGGALSVYDEETKTALRNLQSHVNANKCYSIWMLALQSSWTNNPVWVHGDIAPGNLLVNDGKLSAVIDFGILGIGDPSCDLAMAWTFFDKESRKLFFNEIGCNEETWHRARGWALWKALIVLDENDKNSKAALDAERTLGIILDEFEQLNRDN
ncbi:aminoglycoside phosphotransferase family protein [Paenibacillus sp. GSMTC-2017]|uniref:aminoglycoside phosphotransferase family protein n=1 Tax=Paenibacillus sp. GSMTC-2017 TaxID=2794350 RepID=UPI0018D82C18|nr:aminoglycoside phosphotransferase family protein [Paenibacillus sp. GSMTC-2017]MBH5316223.1 aminoglycoside phosphotransferase family protein [Paenibacillus sp. GSMTC-2017]